MDRLFEPYEGFQAKPLPTEVRAAWLHHRYVQIHPFQDGNGRTGRLLMAYEFARNHEFAPIITAAEKPTYLDMMQASDQGIGGVRGLAGCFARKSTNQTRSAIVRAHDILRGTGVERKANGLGRVKTNGRQVYTGPGGNGDELRRAANAGDARAQAVVGLSPDDFERVARRRATTDAIARDEVPNHPRERLPTPGTRENLPSPVLARRNNRGENHRSSTSRGKSKYRTGEEDAHSAVAAAEGFDEDVASAGDPGIGPRRALFSRRCRERPPTARRCRLRPRAPGASPGPRPMRTVTSGAPVRRRRITAPRRRSSWPLTSPCSEAGT